MRTLIIAEAGVNHNGDVDTAIKLCDAAKKAGADVIKFQTWVTDAIITKNVEQAEYQKKNTKVVESQYDMLKKLELSFDDFRLIKKHCDEIGIEFASTADDRESIDFVYDDLGVKIAKIGSGDLLNIPCLKQVAEKNVPILLATGMADISKVYKAFTTLQQNGAKDITLLHCTTSYPCPYEQVNLRAMITLREAFKCRVGYSDHTIDDTVAIAAVALGAEVIEKHFTLDCNMQGPDHKASMEPIEFKHMVNSIRNIESAMGDGIKQPTLNEKNIISVAEKRIVATKKIKKGMIITEDMLTIKRNNKGFSGDKWDLVVGKAAWKDFNEDEGIEI